jgi:hypothetical protein
MHARALTAALVIAGMLIGGIGITAALIFNKQPSPSAVSRDTVAVPTSAAPPRPQVPTPAEFSVGVIITEQNCAPAGCVYKYTIEPKYIGTHPLPDKEFTVVYEVTGGNQPQVGNFTVQNNQARIHKDVTLEGPAQAQLRAVVTQVVAS